MLNKSQNVVANELLFTASHKFLDNMNQDNIMVMRLDNTCMEFVYNVIMI